MEHSAKLLENRGGVKLEIVSEADPGDGTISLSARIYDDHKTFAEDGWHYDLDFMLAQLDKLIKKELG